MTKDKRSLHDQLKTIADEYAIRLSDVIGFAPQYWVGEDYWIDIADFGDIYFFSLSDMQVVVNHLQGWIERYGSKEKVGEVIIEYMDTLIENDDMTFENGRPRINLWSWLKGLRWKDIGIDIITKH